MLQENKLDLGIKNFNIFFINFFNLILVIKIKNK